MLAGNSVSRGCVTSYIRRRAKRINPLAIDLEFFFGHLTSREIFCNFFRLRSKLFPSLINKIHFDESVLKDTKSENCEEVTLMISN